MTSQCDTCAFGSRGGAAKEPKNRLVGLISAYGASVFWCHHGRDGQEYDWKDSKLGPYLLAPQNRKPCAGWQNYVRNLKRLGFFGNPDYLTIRKCVARRAMVMLEKFLDKQAPPEEKGLARVELTACMKFIAAKDIGNMEIPL